jgi:hypothetical protein
VDSELSPGKQGFELKLLWCTLIESKFPAHGPRQLSDGQVHAQFDIAMCIVLQVTFVVSYS